jgi:hypothetical protein
MTNYQRMSNWDQQPINICEKQSAQCFGMTEPNNSLNHVINFASPLPWSALRSLERSAFLSEFVSVLLTHPNMSCTTGENELLCIANADSEQRRVANVK